MKNSQNKRQLVSVIMPVHNAGSFLREAIESIMNQTYRKFELIIVDDASTDRSWKTIQSLKKKYPRKIRAFRLTEALGQSGDPATNFGIKKAKGQLIAKMDADDVALPKRLEMQVSYLNKNKHVFLVGSHAYIINEKGDILGIKKTPRLHKDIYKSFFLYNNVIHPSMMFRKPESDEDFYDLKFSFFNEYFTFFKLMNKGKLFANIPEPLMNYRVHGSNDTFSSTKDKFRSTLSIRKAFVDEFGYHPSIKQLLTTALQAGAVFLLPEKALIKMYLLSINVITFQSVISELVAEIPRPLSSIKRLAYAISKA